MRIVNNLSVQLTSGTSMNGISREKKNSKITPKIPRGLRSLPVVASTSADAQSEYSTLKSEAARIEQWWSTRRWQHTKRVYSGRSYAH
jgi:hypothetical protein